MTDCVDIMLGEYLSGAPLKLAEPVSDVRRGGSRQERSEPMYAAPVPDVEMPCEMGLPNGTDPRTLDEALVYVERMVQRTRAWELTLLRIMDDGGYAWDLGYHGHGGVCEGAARQQRADRRGNWHVTARYTRQQSVGGVPGRSDFAEPGGAVGETAEPAGAPGHGIAYAKTVTAEQLRLDVDQAVRHPTGTVWPPGMDERQVRAAPEPESDEVVRAHCASSVQDIDDICAA